MRVRRPGSRAALILPLQIGPTSFDGLSDDELREGWRHYGGEIMDFDRPPGSRPWGFWEYELGEEKPISPWNAETKRFENPNAEILRLAELGELTASEYAALAERAHEAKLRIGTGDERLSNGIRCNGISTDVEAVEVLEAVDEVRRGQ